LVFGITVLVPNTRDQVSEDRDQKGAAGRAAAERGRGGGWQASFGDLGDRNPAFPASGRLDNA
jgi:hypothetical protein